MSIRIDRPDSERQERHVTVRIDYDACEVSGACSMVCPEDVFDDRNGQTVVINQTACSSCWIKEAAALQLFRTSPRTGHEFEKLFFQEFHIYQLFDAFATVFHEHPNQLIQ